MVVGESGKMWEKMGYKYKNIMIDGFESLASDPPDKKILVEKQHKSLIN